MASVSGKNQEDTEAREPADSLREDAEESNAADSVAAAATEPPPPALPSESFQEGAHGSPEAGGRDPSPSPATAAAAERKDEETMASAPAGGKPSLPPRPTSVSTARWPSSASGKAPLPPSPTSRDEVVGSGMAEKAKGKTIKAKDQKAEAEKMPRELTGQVLFPVLSATFLSGSCLLVI